LLECRLETGRTHQIRAHMQYIGHPLFSDATYGGDRIRSGQATGSYKAFVENCFAVMPRQALHARSLGFVHPSTGEHMFFEAELPDDFSAVLAKWQDWSESQ
jgi:23S rRNA pseudouridine1911/1915/1917 synthase